MHSKNFTIRKPKQESSSVQDDSIPLVRLARKTAKLFNPEKEQIEHILFKEDVLLPHSEQGIIHEEFMVNKGFNNIMESATTYCKQYLYKHNQKGVKNDELLLLRGLWDYTINVHIYNKFFQMSDESKRSRRESRENQQSDYSKQIPEVLTPDHINYSSHNLGLALIIEHMITEKLMNGEVRLVSDKKDKDISHEYVLYRKTNGKLYVMDPDNKYFGSIEESIKIDPEFAKPYIFAATRYLFTNPGNEVDHVLNNKVMMNTLRKYDFVSEIGRTIDEAENIQLHSMTKDTHITNRITKKILDNK